MISVIMPAYNAGRFIGETLDSILAQTYQDFEIIVINDGSTDNTVAVVEDYMQRDERIKLLHTQNVRQSKARNAGIAIARGEWLAPIDADDLQMPERFAIQLQYAEQKPDVVAWGTYGHRITTEGEVYSDVTNSPRTVEDFNHMRQAGELIMMPNSSCLLRTEIVREIGGYISAYDSLEDVEILERMGEYGPILVVPEILMQYRMHHTSNTGAAKSFRHQRKLFKYLEARSQKRLQGQDLTMDEFLHAYQETPQPQRALRYIDDQSAFHFKMAALLYGEKRYAAMAGRMAASFALNPRYVMHRVLNRVILKREFNNGRI